MVKQSVTMNDAINTLSLILVLDITFQFKQILQHRNLLMTENELQINSAAFLIIYYFELSGIRR